jgi:hypothetical protein
VSGANVAYQEDQGQRQGIYLDNISTDTSADTFNIEMFPKKGLYTLESSVDNIYLYDSDGKNYQNSFFIDDGVYGQKTRVFYHPEDKASTYYAYLSSETSNLYGYKLDQDILITKENGSSIEILYGDVEYPVGVNNVVTIYNPYPFTLNLTHKIDNADDDEVSNPEDSKDKCTFEGFPDVLLPGESKEFTVNFQDPDNSGDTYRCTISAPGVSNFVLLFTGTGSGY